MPTFKKDTDSFMKRSSGFKLKSGNSTTFKMMGSSPMKQDNKYKYETDESGEYIPQSKQHEYTQKLSKKSEKLKKKKLDWKNIAANVISLGTTFRPWDAKGKGWKHNIQKIKDKLGKD